MPSQCCEIWLEPADPCTPLGINNYSALSGWPRRPNDSGSCHSGGAARFAFASRPSAHRSRALRAALVAASPRPPSVSLRSPPAQPFGLHVTYRCTTLRKSASATTRDPEQKSVPTAPTSAHCRSHYSRHLCGRSCGARPHFVHHCLAQSAPHRRPFNRHGGSTARPATVSIPPSLIPQIRPSLPPGAALGSTPDAAGCGACHGTLCPAFLWPFGAKRRPAIVGSSVCSGIMPLRH